MYTNGSYKLMKALFATIASLTLLLGTGVSAPPLFQQGPREIGREIGRGTGNVRPQRPGQGRNLRARDAAPIQEIVEGFYVSRVQQELGLDDAQFARVLPLLRDSLRERNALGQRRARALNQLRQAIRTNASDDELTRRIAEVDESELALREAQVNLLRSVDTGLSPGQRARLRIVQPSLEQRIRNMIERSRAAPRRQR